jgi:HEAT repeat protein
MFAGLAFAQETSHAPSSHLAPTPSTAVSVKADARLSETAQRWGVKAVLVGEGVAVSSCARLCKTGESEVRLVVPEQVRSLARKTQVLDLKDGQKALWVQYGDETKHYSLVILGARRGASHAPPGPPELVFRGQSAPGGAQLSIDPGKNGHEIYVLGGEPMEACGRSFPARAQRLDAETGQFVSVKLPPLTARQRQGAVVVETVFASAAPGEVLLRLESQVAPSTALDGDRIALWKEPYAVAVVSAPLPSPEMEWVVEFAQPLTQPAILHAASDTQVFALHFAPQPGRTYIVPLPQALGCLAWVQNATPLPIVEIMGRLVVDPPPTIPSLVMRLNGAEPGWAGSALGLLGQPAQGALLIALPLLTPAGQSRAVQVAAMSPWGTRVLAHALEFAKEPVQADAARALGERGADGAQALEAQLTTARPEAVPRLSALLFQLDEERGAALILQGLGEQVVQRQEAFRRTFRGLYSDPANRKAFDRQLFTQDGLLRLNTSAQLAVLTSLPPSSNWSDLESALAQVADHADFDAAYQLVPVLALRAAAFPQARDWLVQWMGTLRPPQLNATERAALRSHILQTVLEYTPAEAGQVLSPLAVPLLSDPNVRVRAAAADFLATFPDARGGGALREVLKRDAWPAVRGSAAQALGTLLQQSSGPGLAQHRQQQVEFLSKRLKNEDDPRVREVILRALSFDPTEQVRKVIRRRLVRDDAYQVRAEAAQLLGKLCDVQATEELTRAALQLSKQQVDDQAIRLGLAAVGALARLAPPDLEQRIQPLRAKQVPGLLRVRIQSELDSAARCSASR